MSEENNPISIQLAQDDLLKCLNALPEKTYNFKAINMELIKKIFAEGALDKAKIQACLILLASQCPFYEQLNTSSFIKDELALIRKSFHHTQMTDTAAYVSDLVQTINLLPTLMPVVSKKLPSDITIDQLETYKARLQTLEKGVLGKYKKLYLPTIANAQDQIKLALKYVDEIIKQKKQTETSQSLSQEIPQMPVETQKEKNEEKPVKVLPQEIEQSTTASVATAQPPTREEREKELQRKRAQDEQNQRMARLAQENAERNKAREQQEAYEFLSKRIQSGKSIENDNSITELLTKITPEQRALLDTQEREFEEERRQNMQKTFPQYYDLTRDLEGQPKEQIQQELPKPIPKPLQPLTNKDKETVEITTATEEKPGPTFFTNALNRMKSAWDNFWFYVGHIGYVN